MMTLYVRSQDRLKLIPNPKLMVETDGWDGYWIIDLDTKALMGSYKTEDKATKVLDEIQELLKPNVEWVEQFESAVYEIK